MDRASVKERIGKLRDLIRRYRYEYHVLDKSTISDDALDSLKKELFDLESEHPDLITPDSPTQRIAGEPLKGFEKVNHPGRMLSLNDAFSEQDFRDWKERLDGALGSTYRGQFYCDLKMDGLAVELRYVDGLLVQASTRGDGLVGEDVTQNIRTVDAVPLRLRDDERDVPELVLIRGEAYLTKKEFERMNRRLQKEGKKTHANPRNLAAGTIRQLDANITAERRLSFYAYGLYDRDGRHGALADRHSESYALLRAWGVPTNPNGTVVRSVDEVIKFHATWEKKRDALDYEFDGVVITADDNETYRRAGIVGKAPRGAVAFKFAARQAETVVEDIKVQVGRTGVLTPVAHLKPVHIGGTTVTRATLHNMDEIRRLGVMIGDTVIVGRAGDVIPDIIKVLPELRTGDEKPFRMPRTCPVCGTTVVRERGKVAFVCPNRDCPARRRQDIYHFVSRAALDIDGIGPKIIDQLMDAGLVQDAADLFTLRVDDIMSLERFADVSSRNVVRAIGDRRRVPLHRFIYGLGIPNVGEETAQALAREFRTLEHLRKASREELEAIEDVGPIVAESIVEWFRRPYHRRLLEKFDEADVTVVAERAHRGPLTGTSFVITGTLESLGRDEAKARIRALGGKVSETVSDETDFVVVGEKPGSKYEKALKLGTAILDEKKFLSILNKRS